MIVNRDLCIGCGICEQVCPFGVIIMSGHKPVIGTDCRECGQCARKCPQKAISIETEDTEKKQQVSNSEYWVVELAGSTQKNLSKITLELLSAANRLSQKKPAKVVLLTGTDSVSKDWEDDAASVGCDEILCLKGNPDNGIMIFWTDAVTQAIRKFKPEVVLFPAVADGRDLAPKVACRLRTGLTADCTDLQMDDEGNLLQVRPTYGGSIIATIRTPNHRPQMASVRPNVLPIIAAAAWKKPKVTYLDAAARQNSRVKLVSVREKNAAFQPLDESQIIIAGGYGMGTKENFEMLFKLSQKLNCAVAASRKAVDMGWAPAEIQVGQTGKTVSPQLYLAFGISGALQHTLGMNRSVRIIAVNNDPAAPIMKMCDVPVLGDAPALVKAMLDALENGYMLNDITDFTAE